MNSFKSLKTLLTAVTVMASMNIYGAYNNCETYCAPTCEPECCDSSWSGRFAFDAEFLYWNSSTDFEGFATTGTATTTGPLTARTITASISEQNNNAKYSPGFRIGVGYQFDDSQWDAEVLWTDLYSKSNHNHRTLTGGFFASSNSVLGLLFPAEVAFDAFPTATGTVSDHASSHLNVVDLNFGREISFCRTFSLRPHFDVRYARITESASSSADIVVTTPAGTLTELSTLSEVSALHFHDTFWGVGPMGGLDLNWNWCQNWSIYGKSSFGLLLGKNHSSTSETATVVSTIAGAAAETTTVDLSTSAHRKHDMRLAVSLGAGLEWKTTCLCEDYPIALALGWEHHLYMNSRNANSFYGLNVGANIQF